jgi:hypothetical protein
MTREESPHYRLGALTSAVTRALPVLWLRMMAVLLSFSALVVIALAIDSRTDPGTPVTKDYSQLDQPTPSIDYSVALMTAIGDQVQPEQKETAAQAVTAAVKRVRDKASSIGRLIFTRPSTMRVDKSYSMTIRVAKEPNVNMTEELELEGSLEKRRVKVAGIMAASLSGSEKVFDLTPLSRPEQALESNEYTEWKWQIIPRTSGTHRLRLAVAKKVDTSEGPAFKEERVLDEEFTVTITAAERIRKFAGQHFEFLAGAIFLPPIIVIGKQVARVSRKRARAWLGDDRPQADASVEHEHTDRVKDVSPSKTAEGTDPG